MSKAETESDLAIRDFYVRADQILRVWPSDPSDGSIMAKSFVDIGDRRELSVMEEVEDIIKDVEEALLCR